MVLANVMAGLDSTIINTAIPAIIADLHGIQFIGWIIAIMLLGMSVSTNLDQSLLVKNCNKSCHLLNCRCSFVWSLFQGLADNMYFFLLARALMGSVLEEWIAALYYGWVLFLIILRQEPRF